jgi:hypothetical protein
MMKTLLMTLGLAVFMGAALACFRLLPGRGPEERPAAAESCEALEGQARRDCEQRNGAPR